MRKNNSPIRIFTLFLSGVLLSTNSLFAHLPETNMLPPRPVLIPSLPLAYGTVRKVIHPAGADNGKVVIHIQDVHRNLEAQRNIGNAVRQLINDKVVGLVALEGAFAPVDLTAFRTFRYQDTVAKVADYLLRENKISGPVHAALRLRSEQALPLIVGIDDAAHYAANVEAYRRSAPLVKSAKRNLAEAERQLAALRLKIFNPKLAAYDARVRSYRQGDLGMGAYLQFISKRAPVVPPVAADFLEAFGLESTLNFNRVEVERSEVLARLLAKLGTNERSEFLSRGLAYRMGGERQTDFYAAFKRLCDKHGVDLARFPQMNSYFRYTALAARIDSEKLFDEIKILEEAGYASLIKKPDEKQIVAESKRLYLTAKLLDFSLTKEQWNEYQPGPHFSSFERFYREAAIRDEKMAENLKRQKMSKNVAVLVTGGFHASGIDRRLADAGYTVINFVPKIAKVETEQGAAYLGAFAQEKTPLGKLFAGEKLFLAESPAIAPSAAQPLLYGAGLRDHPRVVDEAGQEDLRSLGFVSVVTNTLELVRVNFQRVFLKFVFGKQGELLSVETGPARGAIATRFNLKVAEKFGLGAVAWVEHGIGYASYLFFGGLVGVAAFFVFKFVTVPIAWNIFLFSCLLTHTIIFGMVSWAALYVAHLYWGVIGRAPDGYVNNAGLPRKFMVVVDKKENAAEGLSAQSTFGRADAATLVAWSGLMISVAGSVVGLSLYIFNPEGTIPAVAGIAAVGFLIGGNLHAWRNNRAKEEAPLVALFTMLMVFFLIPIPISVLLSNLVLSNFSITYKHVLIFLFTLYFIFEHWSRFVIRIKGYLLEWGTRDFLGIEKETRIRWAEKILKGTSAGETPSGPDFTARKPTFLSGLFKKFSSPLTAGMDSISQSLISLRIVPYLQKLFGGLWTIWIKVWLPSIPNTEEGRTAVVEKLRKKLRKAPSREAKRRVMRTYFLIHRGGYVWADSAMEAYLREGDAGDFSTFNYMGKHERLIEPLADFLFSMVKIKGNVDDFKDRKVVDFMIVRLNDPDPQVVKAAIRGLSQIVPFMDESLRLSILNHIFRVMKTHSNPQVVAAMARGLNYIHGIDAIDRILEILRGAIVLQSPHVDLDWINAPLLKSLETNFSKYLKNQSSYLNNFHFAAAFLMQEGENRENDEMVRVNALRALAKLDGVADDILDRLRELLRTEANGSLQKAALGALVRLSISDGSDKKIDELIEFLLKFIEGRHYQGIEPYRSNRYLEASAKEILAGLGKFTKNENLTQAIEKGLRPADSKSLWSQPLSQLHLDVVENPVIFLNVQGARRLMIGQDETGSLRQRLRRIRTELERKGMTCLLASDFYEKRSLAETHSTKNSTHGSRKPLLKIRFQNATMAQIVDQLCLNEPVDVQRREGARGSLDNWAAELDVPIRHRPIVVIGSVSEHGMLERAMGRPLPMVRMPHYMDGAGVPELSPEGFEELARQLEEKAPAFLRPPEQQELKRQSEILKKFAVQFRKNLPKMLSSILLVIVGFFFIAANAPSIYRRLKRYVNPSNISLPTLFVYTAVRWWADVRRRMRSQTQVATPVDAMSRLIFDGEILNLRLESINGIQQDRTHTAVVADEALARFLTKKNGPQDKSLFEKLIEFKKENGGTIHFVGLDPAARQLLTEAKPAGSELQSYFTVHDGAHIYQKPVGNGRPGIKFVGLVRLLIGESPSESDIADVGFVVPAGYDIVIDSSGQTGWWSQWNILEKILLMTVDGQGHVYQAGINEQLKGSLATKLAA